MAKSKQLDQFLLEFCWSAWTEFGVSGWTRSHTDWDLDPEALLILTACVCDSDLRLRGEVLDWCANNESLLSRARTRTLLRAWPVADAWPAFATDLSAATGKMWEGAKRKGSFRPTGKGELSLQDRPSTLALRLRALLGVGARSEIIRVLLLAPESRSWSKQELAEEIAYTRRNVHDAVNHLHAAGSLRTLDGSTRARYLLDHRSSWSSLVAPLPTTGRASAFLLRAAWHLRCAAAELRTTDPQLRSLEARRWWTEIEADLKRAGCSTPSFPLTGSAWTQIRAFHERFFENLASGRWPPA